MGWDTDENGLYTGDVEKYNYCVFLLSEYKGPNLIWRKFKYYDGNLAWIERFGGQTHLFLPNDVGITNQNVGVAINKHYALNKETLVNLVRGSDSIFLSMPTIWSDSERYDYTQKNGEEKTKIALSESPNLIFSRWFIPEKIVQEIYQNNKI